jgi:RNA polymerase sigma-70 factor, ECF subfamily
MTSYALETDQTLMTRLRQRDTHALAALYDRHSRRVYSLCLMILQQEQMAEEATQDVFMKLWNAPQRYTYDADKFVAWLMMITRHAAIDALRREKRHFNADTPIDDEAARALPDVSQIEDARWREMKHVLESLPSEQRSVIELAFYHGLSHSEISEHLAMPLGSVKTRLRIGMERLRGILFAGLAPST